MSGNVVKQVGDIDDDVEGFGIIGIGNTRDRRDAVENCDDSRADVVGEEVRQVGRIRGVAEVNPEIDRGGGPAELGILPEAERVDEAARGASGIDPVLGML